MVSSSQHTNQYLSQLIFNMSAPTVQTMTRVNAYDESVKTKNPMLERFALLEDRIAALEKEVSQLRSIPKKNSLSY